MRRLNDDEGKLIQKAKQYWSEHILLTIASLIVGSVLIILLRHYLNSVPRGAIPFVATIFATLLGLTFTSFAIFTAFLPNIRIDFLRTETFSNEGRTFRFTIYLEISTMTLSFLDYVLFNTNLFTPLLYLLVLLMILSIGFFTLLIRDTFLLFEHARKWRIERS